MASSTRLIITNPTTDTTNPPAMTTGRPSRGARIAADGAAAPTTTDGTRLHSAAVSGLNPSTDWRYCVRITALPMIANIARMLTTTEPPNRRSVRARTSSIGTSAVS